MSHLVHRLQAPPRPAADKMLVEDVEVAEFGLRFAALCVDLVLFGAIIGLFFLVGRKAVFLPVVVLCIVAWLYGASQGWSPGKLIVGIRITLTDGNPPGWKVALKREILGKYRSYVFLGFGHLSAKWDPRGQAWHDKIAGTIVVRKPR